MNSFPSPCEQAAAFIKRTLLHSGACACGITAATEVDAAWQERYNRWLEAGKHAGMDYMARNMELRNDPRLLHEGTRSVIAAAFNYRPAQSSAYIADYALGSDYHFVLKSRLAEAGEAICRRLGGSFRAVVDSAPMRERYWARKCGIGYVADNGLLCVPGYGMTVVLGFILWTGEAACDTPCDGECLHCGRCRIACPGGALGKEGAVDASRCLSCLTIEHRGELPADMPHMTKVYGCDCCRTACPLDRGPITDIPEFLASDDIMALTPHVMATMTTGQFKKIFGSSAVLRLRVQNLRRNALHYLSDYK